MIRYVHHELMSGIAVAAAAVVHAAIMYVVRGEPPVEAESVGKGLLGLVFLLGFTALWLLLMASRLKWFSEVRHYESAVPLRDPAAALSPADGSLRPRTVHWVVFAVILAIALAMSFFAGGWATVFFVWLALSWLGQAALGARWERRRGVLLWNGHVEEQPLGEDRFLYTSPRPWPPARATADVPPAGPDVPGGPGRE